MKILRYPAVLGQKDIFGVFSHFTESVNSSFWSSTLSDSGSVTVGSGTGGIVPVVPSDGTVADNDEAYLYAANSVFKFLAGQPLYAEARVQFTEANTNAANMMFGLLGAWGANSLVDNGGGPQASFSGAVIYKIDGGTVWRCKSSVGTTNIDSVSTKTAGGSAYQVLSIDVEDVKSDTMTITFKVDGQPLFDATSGQVIRHNLAIAGAAAMAVGAGVKNGSTSLETLNVDYMGAWQVAF